MSYKILSLLCCAAALLLYRALPAHAFVEPPDEDSHEYEEMMHEESRQRQRMTGGVLCHGNMIAVQGYQPVTSNGCTGADMIKMMNSKEDFTYCCDLHDACYQTCGMTQKMCDAKFKACMGGMCHTTFATSETCNNLANLYFMATSALGGAFYEDAQSDHCECVDIRASVVQERYKKLISAFYTKHAPQAASKFDFAKYAGEYQGSPRKWGNLLYNLYAKYDNAIIHVDSRIAKGKQVPRPNTATPLKPSPELKRKVEAAAAKKKKTKGKNDAGSAPGDSKVPKMPEKKQEVIEQFDESDDEEFHVHDREPKHFDIEGDSFVPHDHEKHGVREESNPSLLHIEDEHLSFVMQRSKIADEWDEMMAEEEAKAEMRAQEGEEL